MFSAGVQPVLVPAIDSRSDTSLARSSRHCLRSPAATASTVLHSPSVAVPSLSLPSIESSEDWQTRSAIALLSP